MAVKKPAKSDGSASPAARSAPKSEKKLKPITLTPRQRRVFEALRRAVVDGDYELLRAIDKKELDSLFRKNVVQLPKIQQPAVKGTISHEALRKALLAVKKERSKAGTAPNG